MSDYQRFVSYLYAYQNNIKNRNCGFSRMEIRNHHCRLDIHLKLPVYPFTPTLKVYVFVASQEKLYGIFLGNATYQLGNVTASFSFYEQNINGSSYNFSDLGGILIQSDSNLCFASAWKDITIRPEHFVVYTKKEESNSGLFKEKNCSLPNSPSEAPLDQSPSKPCQPDAQTSSALPVEAEIVSESTTLQEEILPQEPQIAVETELPSEYKNESTAKPEPAIKTTTASELTVHSTPKQKNSDNTTQEQNLSIQPAIETSAPDLLAASTDTVQNPSTPKPANFWETILKSYPQQHLFFDDEIHNCVQLSPRDVPKITASGYPISNNAFFRHNCQSFQHFLIGKKEDHGKSQYILAVPGVFNPKEQYMASMFGFPHFKSSQNSQFRNNCWGYWYRIIPEHWNDCKN